MQTDDVSAADSIDDLVGALKGAPVDRQLTIVGAVIETLRLIVTAVPASKRNAAVSAALNAFSALGTLPIEKADFSLLRTVKSEKFNHLMAHLGPEDEREIRARVRLNVVKIFMNVLQLEPEAATQELVAELLKDEAANFPKPQTAVARFEINQPATVLRTFKPKPFVYVDADPRLMLVQYKGEMPGGGLGPSLWGVSYTDEESDTSHVILETGEYITVPSGSLTLAGVTTPSDVPAYLLACAHLFMPLVLLKYNKLSDTAEAFHKLQARFGEFTKPLYFHQAPAHNVSSLTGVIESAKWQFGGTAPVGATANFLVPELASDGTYVMVVAESAAIRPYVYANLVAKVAGKDTILMRIDRPREFSALGVYLFPMQDYAVALIVHPQI